VQGNQSHEDECKRSRFRYNVDPGTRRVCQRTRYDSAAIDHRIDKYTEVSLSVSRERTQNVKLQIQSDTLS